MQNLENLQEIFEEELKKVQLPSTPDYLYESIEYTLNLGGKRIRPTLLLSSCEFFGGKIKDAINPAIGIEIFHNFTLIHDDIMDVAPIRRGKPTVYKKWDQNTAILAGDTMFAMAYEYVAKAPDESLRDVLKIFTQTAIEVCEGQQLDLNYENIDDIKIDDYINMIRLKTGVLLGCSLKMGAAIANATKDEQQTIYDFGINLGLAFQLKDDLLDSYSDVQKFGKTKGGDIAVGKKSYLYLKTIELIENLEGKKEFIKLYNEKNIDTQEKINKVIKIYNANNTKEATQTQIKNYSQKAIENLMVLKQKGFDVSGFEDFTNNLINRDY